MSKSGLWVLLALLAFGQSTIVLGEGGKDAVLEQELAQLKNRHRAITMHINALEAVEYKYNAMLQLCSQRLASLDRGEDVESAHVLSREVLTLQRDAYRTILSRLMVRRAALSIEHRVMEEQSPSLRKNQADWSVTRSNLNASVVQTLNELTRETGRVLNATLEAIRARKTANKELKATR